MTIRELSVSCRLVGIRIDIDLGVFGLISILALSVKLARSVKLAMSEVRRSVC